MERIKLIIVDDQKVIRAGLVRILKSEPDMEVVAEAGGYDELLSYLRLVQPEIVLLDVSLDGKNGLDTLREIKRLYPHIKTIMLSIYPEELYAVRAIRAGAVGYLTKDAASDELVFAIRQVHSRGKYITPRIAERLIEALEVVGTKPDHEKLSERELQVLSMIARGRKVKDIAKELDLSPATIATYRSRILEKMRLKSNVELAGYALRHHLVE